MSDHATVIGLVGYAGSGKDAFASTLVEEHGFERLAFADAVRDALYALNPVIPMTPVGRLQHLVDRVGWDEAKAWLEVRELLQRMGDEVGRQLIGPDTWVDVAVRKVRPVGRYVFTDVRYPNEFNAIHDRGGYTVRIQRPGVYAVNGHASESALDGHACSEVVFNNRDLEHLRDVATKFMYHLGLA